MSSPKRGHRQHASAVLSMPNLYRATELSYESTISKFQTYIVQQKDSTDDNDDATKMLMKSVKNEKCIALTLKYILDQLETLEHNNLPRIEYVTFSDNYSYIVFEKPDASLQPITQLFDTIKHNELICKSICYELCRTMLFTHAFGVVHKDLRPNNIFVSLNNETVTKVMLIDFGCTKALQSDEKLAIFEQGSGFLTHYVRGESGQFPAPEILMDLRYDRMCDAWFLGILIYMILNGGKIPFIGEEDEDIQDSILHSSDNKFSLLKEQLQHGSGELNEQWMNISDELFDIINGLLTKDAKKRYCIEFVLWSEWIPKREYRDICEICIAYYLRVFGANKSSKRDAISECIGQYVSIGNNIVQSSHKGEVKWCNKDRTVMHQFKVCNYNTVESAFIRGECNVTISSNIWCKHSDNPITIEYEIEYAKYDCYFGIICANEYERDSSFYHFIGSDPNSISLSVRYGKAWLNSDNIGEMKRNEYLAQNMSERRNKAQKVHNIQQTFEDSEVKEDGSEDSRFSGPPPLRNVSVCLRIDSMSRTLSFKINDVILDPLYFEFPGFVQPAFTLCNCMDQVTIKSVYYDQMENLQNNA